MLHFEYIIYMLLKLQLLLFTHEVFDVTQGFALLVYCGSLLPSSGGNLHLLRLVGDKGLGLVNI